MACQITTTGDGEEGVSYKRKMMALAVTTKCKELADNKFKDKNKKNNYNENHNYKLCDPESYRRDVINEGNNIHEMISSAEENRIHIKHIDENNKRECDLLNLISKLIHLKTYGYASEISLSWIIHGVFYKSRVDRLNWNKETNVLEICDLKTHAQHFIPDDEDKVVLPEVGKQTEYYYRLQLHFYAAIVKAYLVDELDEKHHRSLRRRLVGPVFNPDKPIHPMIAETCNLPFETSLSDLFETFLDLRKEFQDAKIRIYIYHVDQLRMRSGILSNGGMTDKGTFDVICKPYRYLPNWLDDELVSTPMEMERRHAIEAEKKRKSVPVDGKRKSKSKKKNRRT